MNEETNFLKKVQKHTQNPRCGMFTWKFKMAAIFCKNVCHYRSIGRKEGRKELVYLTSIIIIQNKHR